MAPKRKAKNEKTYSSKKQKIDASPELNEPAENETTFPRAGYSVKYLLNLPEKVILKISRLLSLSDLSRLSRVAKCFHDCLDKELYQRGSNERDPTVYIATGLQRAAYRGLLQGVRKLIEAGADPRQKTMTRESPLSLAASEGYAELVWALGPTEADMAQTNIKSDTLLHAAVQGKNISIVRKFLDLKAIVYAKGEDKFTPLHRAAMNGFIDGALLLIESGANVNARSLFGHTPLDCVPLTAVNLR